MFYSGTKVSMSQKTTYLFIYMVSVGIVLVLSLTKEKIEKFDLDKLLKCVINTIQNPLCGENKRFSEINSFGALELMVLILAL